MLYVPRKGDLRVQHNLATVGTAATLFGTSVTSGASSATKGTPVQLIASTNFDAFWVRIIASNVGASTQQSDGCLDILIGAATESVLIPDLLNGYAGGSSTGMSSKVWDFPLYIPAGSRIAAQTANVRTSTASRVGIILYGGQDYPMFPVGTKVTTYGTGTVPLGTAITQGASGAEGGWTEITASTTEDHIALVPSYQFRSDGSTVATAHYVDVGFGAATEEEIGQSYIYRADTAEQMEGPWNPLPIFKDIPSGSRLVMRSSSSGTADTVGGSLHGVS